MIRKKGSNHTHRLFHEIQHPEKCLFCLVQLDHFRRNIGLECCRLTFNIRDLFIMSAALLSVKNELACEGQEVTMSCGRQQLLLVRTARYGVLVGQCGALLAAASPTCFRAVWHVVHTRCTGRARCRFRVTEHVFGDPCPDQSQTLDIEYACVRGKSGGRGHGYDTEFGGAGA